MIYYPLSALMFAGIHEVLIISTSQDIAFFKDLLITGNWLGMKFEYAIQDTPGGLAETFIISGSFIGTESYALVLGDTIFYGRGFFRNFDKCGGTIDTESGAIILGYYVKDLTAYGVVEFDKNRISINIEEKPKIQKSNYAVHSLCFYDNTVIEITKNVRPSVCGELEITAINNKY